MKVRVEKEVPFWKIEQQYLQCLDKVKKNCIMARTLAQALDSGLNSIRLDVGNDTWVNVGYKDENGEYVLNRPYHKTTVETLKHMDVEFVGLDEDADGYTVGEFRLVF